MIVKQIIQKYKLGYTFEKETDHIIIYTIYKHIIMKHNTQIEFTDIIKLT